MRNLETEYAFYEFDGHTLLVSIKENLFLEVEDMEKILQEAVDFVGYRKYAVIVDTRAHVQTSKEAREYYADSEYNKYRVADALLVNSLAMKLVVNFFMRFHKPEIPTKMFDNLESARTWLSTFSVTGEPMESSKAS